MCKAPLRNTARMYIGALCGRLGLHGAAARRSATWPLALVGLGATSPTCDTLYAIAPRVPRTYVTLIPRDIGSANREVLDGPSSLA